MYSGFVTLIALNSTTTNDIAEAIYYEVILRSGVFQTLQSDNACNLTKGAMEEICRLLTIKSRKTIAYASWTNGKCEVAIKQLGTLLKKLCLERSDWEHFLRIIEYSINMSPNSKMNMTPFF